MTDKQEVLFGDAFPKAPLEPDRLPLAGGIEILITDILISTQTRYEKIAKINGLVLNQPMKYRTTSKTVVKSCEDILAKFGEVGKPLRVPVRVKVVEMTSNTGRKYLTLE